MFALSRPHRQILCTLALVAFAVLPTGYVAITAWRVNQPSHVRAVEDELSRRIGLHVSLEGVRYPRPGSVIYRGAVVSHEEPRQKASTPPELARAESILLRRDGREFTLIVDGLRLHSPSPRQAIAQINTLLSRASSSEFDRVNLSARTCTIDLGGKAAQYSVQDVAATCQTARGGSTVSASYKVVDGDSASRCELAVVRERRADAVRTTLTFQTVEGVPVSARVLDLFFGSEQWLGRDARVEGELVLSQSGTADWEAKFRGALIDVDLGALVGHLAPQHRMAGLARIRLESAHWADQPGRGSGWTDARGDVLAGPGRIGPDLLRALQAQLKFRVSDKVDFPRRDCEFQSLGLAFALTRDGELRFAGALGAESAPGAVIIQDQRVRPLLSAPEGVATVAGLIRTLVPQSASRPELLVPASFESQVIQRYLPAPSSRRDVPPALHAN
jgi:hypothetical protein